jgi:CelD/BcsL family acetyltransferase involved in cellulose biosynthesis
MRRDIEIVNPMEVDGWDESLTACEGRTFFHTAAWAKVLWATYHYRPLYFVLRGDGRLLALIPMMEVRSPLTGRRGVSLPFSDYCGPVVADETDIGSMNEFVMDYGRRAGWKSIEYRGDCFQDAPAETSFYRHTLDLTPGVEPLFAALKDSTRRNIRKAMREGVHVGIHGSMEAVAEYYRLHCMTRRKHGLPPQPRVFFEKIYEHVISKDLGMVVLASHHGVNVAGDLFFGFAGRALYKYGASDQAYQHVRPSDLVMWEGIKWYARNGYRTLCLGRTEPDNGGLRRFKTQWGADEQIINYYRYDVRRNTFVARTPHVSNYCHHFFQAMPIPLLRMFGSLLYKHIG